MIKKLEFRACISPIMSGIRTGGDGMRVSIDIPESDVIDATALIALRNCPLKITVEVDDSPVATRVRLPDEENAPTAAPDAQAGAKETKPKKSDKPHGEHGKLWEALHHKSFNTIPAVKVLIQTHGVGAETPEETIRRVFDVPSRTFISAEQLIGWLEKEGSERNLDVSFAIKTVRKAARQ